MLQSSGGEMLKIDYSFELAKLYFQIKLEQYKSCVSFIYTNVELIGMKEYRSTAMEELLKLKSMPQVKVLHLLEKH